MGTARLAIPSTIGPSSARYRNNGSVIDSERGARQGRPSSLPDSDLSGSASQPEATKKHTGIPTIEVSDPGDPEAKVKGDHNASPRFGLTSRSPSPIRHIREGLSGSKLAALKKKTYHALSLIPGKDADKREDGLLKAPLTDDSSGSPAWKRRATSMPNSLKDILHHADPVATRSFLAPGSPPIVDFTRFEDRYRSPSSDYDSLFSVSKGSKAMSYFSLTKGKMKSKPVNNGFASELDGHTENGGGDIGTSQAGGVYEMKHNSSSRNVLYPANGRKLDPSFIMDALESASDMVDVRRLDLDDLLEVHDVEQQNFELRERNALRGKNTRGGKTRTVFGESIQHVFRYASMSIILGEREYILPIVVVHCVEELYRTGIYQSNLFRILPNRPRLHELISIFDSEEQPSGSIIRSRQSSPSSLEGFGAATSLHLESTPDICALLTSYLSAMPEPIIPRSLFEAIWELCGVDQQPHTDFSGPTPALPADPFATVRLSSIPLARSYTSESEANSILIAQLLLHLLPSPNFFLFVYLLSFFSQVALVREENGIGIEDLSKIFGARIYGHGYGDVSLSKPASHLHSSSRSIKAKGKEKRNGRGEAMMVWFLRRWGPLSETLFEVTEDAKLGVLHRNKYMRKDSLGIDAMTSAYEAAHKAVESEVRDGQGDGVENLVDRDLLEEGDVNGSVDLPVVGSSRMVCIADSQVPASISSRSNGAGLMAKDARPSSSTSSGSSSSTLPPYTARPSPTVEDSLCHSTPKITNNGDRTVDSINLNEDADEEPCLPPVMATRQQEEPDNVGRDQSVDNGESAHSLKSLHERLLDVSMPISIFDFDETMPLSPNQDNTLPLLQSLTSAPALSVTPKQGHEPHLLKVAGRRLPSNNAGLTPPVSALRNSSSGTFSSDRRRSSVSSSIVSNAFPSPSPAPLPESMRLRSSQPRLPISLSTTTGFQTPLCVPSVLPMPAVPVRNLNEVEKDTVIHALRERLVEVEKERDEARRIVTEVRRAIRNVDENTVES